jgi:hypothetical protein
MAIAVKAMLYLRWHSARQRAAPWASVNEADLHANRAAR